MKTITDNYEVSDITSTVLGQGREDAIIYPVGCKEGRNPVMKKDAGASDASYGAEQKVGDHHEYA